MPTFAMRICLALGLCLLLLACQPNEPPTSPSASPATAAPTLAPSETVVPTLAPSATTSGTLNLVVWMSDEFAQAPLQSGGQTLATEVEGFHAAFANIRIAIQPKKPSGKGGLTDLLVATQSALPQALPDLVTLDLRDVPRLARDGTLQAFDPRFAPALQSDWYPFARQAGQVDGRLYAAPFTTDLVQLAYDTTQLKSAPLTWTDVISSGAKYAVALGGENGLVSDSFLAQYVALGGRFSDARGKPALDRTPLRDTLEFYHSGVAQGFIISNTLSLKSSDEAWRAYTANRAALVDASARQFLRERAQTRNTAFGSIPTHDGNLVTISRGWGYAIITQDAARHAAAEKFIEWMLTAENNALWNRAASRVPVRKGALSLWTNDGAYRDFTNQLLNVAVNHPAALNDNALDGALQTALANVLSNSLTPAAAADKAIAALAR